MDKSYSLRKSKKVFFQVYHGVRRKKDKIPATEKQRIYDLLTQLQTEILAKNKEQASLLAKQAERISAPFFKKNFFSQSLEFVFALAFAICVAFLVRQVWFEFYEIPTGSMRPTFKEQDRLMVSKTTFGINTPMTTSQMYFDTDLVQRSGIVIFTGENMDISDVDTNYFYVFPGKKQYIKRLIAKPGDTVYFYGGKIYGISAEGEDITPQLQRKELEKIEHIPFLQFEGKVVIPEAPKNGISPVAILYQMNEPVARLFCTPTYQIEGEMLPLAPLTPQLSKYSDLWGFKNFGMSRLLTKEEVNECTDSDTSSMEDGVLYLEIRHHPGLQALHLTSDYSGRVRPALNVNSTVIPLQKQHLETLFSNLYTARFIVKNEVAMRYGMPSYLLSSNSAFLPKLPGVPDGTYEFYYGKAYQIFWQGLAEELPANHPIYEFDNKKVQTLYNLGIEFDTKFSPYRKNQPLYPSRYVYFYENDLYALGAPLLTKEDPTLLNFLDREYTKQTASTYKDPYQAFQDYGAPLKENGELDVTFIKQYGLKLPAKSYLALGDNHAMSSDSRVFGFVPEGNLRGGPDFIFWPPGPRFGAPDQPPYPFVNLPRTIVWAVCAIILGMWWVVHKKRTKLPISLT